MSNSGHVQTLAVSGTLCISMGYRCDRPAHACTDENTIGNDDCGATATDLSRSRHQPSMATAGLGLHLYLGGGDAGNYYYFWRADPRQGRDQFDGLKVIAPFIQANFWIVEQLIGIGVLLAIFAGVYGLVRHRNARRWIWLGLRTVALIIALFYAGRYVHAAYRVTERNSRVPLYETSGQRLQREMPENACFFLDDERVGAHFDLMYYADSQRIRFTMST